MKDERLFGGTMINPCLAKTRLPGRRQRGSSALLSSSPSAGKDTWQVSILHLPTAQSSE
jgi:hypothetical protein